MQSGGLAVIGDRAGAQTLGRRPASPVRLYRVREGAARGDFRPPILWSLYGLPGRAPGVRAEAG
jgi:hypothetical protein